MGDRLRAWFAPPRPGRPADVLRWVRRVQLAMAPFGLLFAAELLATGDPLWWIGLACTGALVIGATMMELPIRRVEHLPAPDPATAPERRRRATRATLILFGAMAVIVVGVCYLVAGVGLAIVIPG